MRSTPPIDSRLMQAYGYVLGSGERGITWRNYADRYGLHHGQASGALSMLDHLGYIVRLKERRERCSVYVVPDHVHGRNTIPHKTNRQGAAAAASLLMAMSTECDVPDEQHDAECWKRHASCALLQAAMMINGEGEG